MGSILGRLVSKLDDEDLRRLCIEVTEVLDVSTHSTLSVR